MGGLSRCEHPGWRPTLFVPPTEGSHESEQTLTMLAGATAAPLIALAVAACGNDGGGASASPTMRPSPEVPRRLELTRDYRLVMRFSPTNGNDAA